MRYTILVAGWSVCALVLFQPQRASADVFGSGANSFAIDFVPVILPDGPEGYYVNGRLGDLIRGNQPDFSGDPTPAGSVPYSYRIGKYEISEQMIDKANALGGLGITKDARGPDKPATSISWFEAARFVNWLNDSTGNVPAYKFDTLGEFQLWMPSDPGYDANNLFRNRLAKYFLPSMDEWYKAAYFDPVAGVYWDFATGSNAPPTAIASGTLPGSAVFNQPLAAGPADVTLAGGLSPYGTMAQGGNAWEWEETAFDLSNDDPQSLRGGRGAGWAAVDFSLSANVRSAGFPQIPPTGAGFRIGSIIPEPSGAMLFGVALSAFGGLRRFLACRLAVS